MSRVCVIVFIALFGLLTGLPVEGVSAEWAEKWRSDLEFLSTKLPETHPNLFHTISKDQFHSDLNRLTQGLSSMQHHQITVELARLLASIGDGHTRLSLPFAEGIEFFQGHATTDQPKNPSLVFRQYPIRLYNFSDGLFVQRIDKQYADAAGARVIRIGKMSAEEALTIVSNIVEHDNDSQLKGLAPTRLVIPEVLHALSIADDMENTPFIVKTTQGKQLELSLKPVAPGTTVDWHDANVEVASRPLYQRNTDDSYWYEYLKEYRAVYFQYNQVAHKKEEPLDLFMNRLFKFVEDNPVDRMIIDLRWNRGGDNTLNQMLLHKLICSRQFQKPGSLFVLTGRYTFSAAVMLAVDLENHTPAIFIGEPTAGRPNSYGDSRKIILPNTGLTARISTLYWQGDPRDNRPWVPPHISIEPGSRDYMQNTDPVLSKLLESSSTVTDASGKWDGSVRALFYEIQTSVQFNRTADVWNGTINTKEFDLVNAPLSKIHFTEKSFHFEAETKFGILTFDGVFLDGKMVGKIDRSGRIYTFVFDRK